MGARCCSGQDGSGAIAGLVCGEPACGGKSRSDRVGGGDCVGAAAVWRSRGGGGSHVDGVEDVTAMLTWRGRGQAAVKSFCYSREGSRERSCTGKDEKKKMVKEIENLSEWGRGNRIATMRHDSGGRVKTAPVQRGGGGALVADWGGSGDHGRSGNRGGGGDRGRAAAWWSQACGGSCVDGVEGRHGHVEVAGSWLKAAGVDVVLRLRADVAVAAESRWCQCGGVEVGNVGRVVTDQGGGGDRVEAAVTWQPVDAVEGRHGHVEVTGEGRPS
ncbi:hypothetical protein EDB89DRAFT_1912566 [Lactarius sanguifluus]|nr:hypothetical protein EDB89DRAFT_1912566 [Lactarius sanguifluus]